MTKYRRILIKLSGESLAGDNNSGIDVDIIKRTVQEIKTLLDNRIQVALVIGGGNFFRGLQGAGKFLNRVDGDYMGMLATIMNAVALRNFFREMGINAHVMSALKTEKITEDLYPPKAIDLLEKGQVVIFAGGTGNPFFTTDTAGVLRAVEIQADVMLKATRVDGIYNKDPEKHKNAVKFEKISYNEALEKNLRVMDLTAFALAKENGLPIIVFNFNQPGILEKIVIKKESLGTIVH